MTDESSMPEKKCKNCGAAFFYGQKNRVFCSSRCKKSDFNRRNRQAVNERQKVYAKTPAGKAAAKKYQEKIGNAAKEITKSKRASKDRVRLESWFWSIYRLSPSHCQYCKSLFYPERPQQIYCSGSCRSESARIRSNARTSRPNRAVQDARYRARNIDKIREYDRSPQRLARASEMRAIRKSINPEKFKAYERFRSRKAASRRFLGTAIAESFGAVNSPPVCVGCGSEFSQSNNAQKYCSSSCRKENSDHGR